MAAPCLDGGTMSFYGNHLQLHPVKTDIYAEGQSHVAYCSWSVCLSNPAISRRLLKLSVEMSNTNRN